MKEFIPINFQILFMTQHSFILVGPIHGEKRKNYPKCVPIAKARGMSKEQKRGAVARKQAVSNTGPKPARAATFAKRKKAMDGGYTGGSIKSNYDGKILSNPSYVKYYRGLI